MKNDVINKIKGIVEEDNFKLDENLQNHNTFKIKSSAKYYLTPKTKDQLIELLDLLKEEELPYFILGGGSDVILPDEGIEKIVIHPSNNNIHIEGERETEDDNHQNGNNEIMFQNIKVESRHKDVKGSIKNFISLEDLKYEEDESNKVQVTVGAGVNLAYLIQYTLNNNLCGLQWFGYIPSNIGGAIFNNIHGLHKFLSDYLYSVTIFNKFSGKIEEKLANDMHFGYDDSSVQKGDEVVIEAKLLLYKGDIEKAKYTYNEILKRKINNQPKSPSAGSVFKNLDPNLAKALNIPNISAGWLIDSVGLLGTRIGGAEIYENHGNFIINKDNAKAEDVKALVKLAQDKVYEKWNILLEPEIKFV